MGLVHSRGWSSYSCGIDAFLYKGIIETFRLQGRYPLKRGIFPTKSSSYTEALKRNWSNSFWTQFAQQTRICSIKHKRRQAGITDEAFHIPRWRWRSVYKLKQNSYAIAIAAVFTGRLGLYWKFANTTLADKQDFKRMLSRGARPIYSNKLLSGGFELSPYSQWHNASIDLKRRLAHS